VTHIGSRTPSIEIVAFASVEDVPASLTEQFVLSIAAGDVVVILPPTKLVAAVTPRQHIVADPS
jgi:hypothetical protein